MFFANQRGVCAWSKASWGALARVAMAGVLALVFLGVVVTVAEAYCKEDTNILSDSMSKTCWECMFPVGMSGFTLYTGDQDDVAGPVGPGISAVYPELLCGCLCFTPYLCVPGLPIGYFEPVRLMEAVHDQLCFPTFGTSLGGAYSFLGQGSESTQIDDLDQNHGYMQVHYIAFPLWYIVGLIVDTFCDFNYSIADIDVLFLSEVDPTWNDDILSAMLAPETLLISNPIALMACIADSVAAAFTWPLDPLFWCAGSSGYLYPMDGNVSGSGNDLNASMLMVYRMLAKLARVGLETWSSADGSLICSDMPTGLIVKSQYKFQLIYPIANSSGDGCCYPMGRTPFTWGLAKEIPAVGEDFVWLMWKLQRCCLL